MLFPGNYDHPGRHAGEYDPRSNRWRFFLPTLAILLAVALLAWPFLEPLIPDVEQRTLRFADFPADIGQLRVVYVSDIHKGPFFSQGRVDNLVSRINAMNADLVLLGGDYASDSNGAVDFFRTMPHIYARYGVYAVPGNHDRTVPESNLNQLRSAMQAAGVTPLVNTVAPVRIGNRSIYLAGIDDVSCGHPELAAVASQVRKEDFVIFLCHSPAIITDAVKARDKNGSQGWFDLALFGHTHGGQVALLGSLLHDGNVPPEYTQGWFKHNRADMLVSRGVGTSGLPIRLLCTPQIHLITVNAPR